MQKIVVIATNRLDDVSKLYNTDSRRENFVGILYNGRFAVFDRFSELQRGVAEADSTESPPPNWFNELFLEVTKT